MDFKEWRRQHEGKAENETVNGADGSTVNKPEASPATEEMMPVSQNGERAELQIADEATHSVALESARNRLGDEDVTRISGELTRIAALELESFDMLQQSGNLPAKTIAEHRELRNAGIDCGQFTPDEIHEIRQFAADATPEIRERKFEMLSNVVTNTRFGAYGERTKNRDPEKAARLNWIADKLALFDEGKFDESLNYGFDIQAAIRRRSGDRMDSGDSESDFTGGDIYGYSESDPAYIRFMRETPVDEFTVDELVEYEYIDEGDVLVYGPLTRDDVDDIRVFSKERWVDATNFRFKPRLGQLLEEINSEARSGDISIDLTREYIAREMLKKRRLNGKDLLSLSTAFGEETVERMASQKLPGGEPLKRELQLISYYTGRVLGMKIEEIKKNFGAARPITPEFFQEARARLNGMTEMQLEAMEEYQATWLTRLDDHLFIAEAMLEEANDAAKPASGMMLEDLMNSPEDEQGASGSIGARAAEIGSAMGAEANS